MNQTFATNPDTPAPGLSLYRFSTGHGGLQCSACHGSTHAEFPSSHDNDNIQSMQIQGHAGPLVECVSCHPNGVSTVERRPARHAPRGADLGLRPQERRGRRRLRLPGLPRHRLPRHGALAILRRPDRSAPTFGTKKFWNGFQIGCYTCHNGPSSDEPNPNAAPVVTNLTASTTAGAPVAIALHATDANGDPLILRIVGQPKNGTAGLSGTTATYYPTTASAGPTPSPTPRTTTRRTPTSAT